MHSSRMWTARTMTIDWGGRCLVWGGGVEEAWSDGGGVVPGLTGRGRWSHTSLRPGTYPPPSVTPGSDLSHDAFDVTSHHSPPLPVDRVSDTRL